MILDEDIVEKEEAIDARHVLIGLFKSPLQVFGELRENAIPNGAIASLLVLFFGFNWMTILVDGFYSPSTTFEFLIHQSIMMLGVFSLWYAPVIFLLWLVGRIFGSSVRLKRFLKLAFLCLIPLLLGGLFQNMLQYILVLKGGFEFWSDVLYPGKKSILMIVGLVYSLFLLIAMVKEIQVFTWAKAFLNMLLTAIVLLLVYLVYTQKLWWVLFGGLD
ncbi:MAG: YIP1 family protein [Schleiferiaceae bacterium]|jgi:hypothetical protein|nr:YIP1 family protein [Schleiferiaceae bacterium]